MHMQTVSMQSDQVFTDCLQNCLLLQNVLTDSKGNSADVHDDDDDDLVFKSLSTLLK